MSNNISQRFWDKVEKTESCWNWTAYKDRDGYGHFKTDKISHYAHRFSYELFKNKIPQDKELDHLCRNRKCVNPNHLEVVTHKENMLRGESIQTKNAQKTHCVNGHEFNEENTYVWKNNNRRCRVCNRNVKRNMK